jgi:hypothetical protein
MQECNTASFTPIFCLHFREVFTDEQERKLWKIDSCDGWCRTLGPIQSALASFADFFLKFAKSRKRYH